MAKQDKTKINNAKPTESFKTRTLSFKSQDGTDCTSEVVSGNTATLDVIRYNEFEVGNGTQSSFSGTDSYGNEIKNATFHEREPLYMRYNYINDIDDYIDGDTSNQLSNVLTSEYFYDQDSEGEGKSRSRIPRWEKQIRPFITYDEEYFQHVYNWPTSHTLKPRTVGGFVEEQAICGCGTPNGGSTSTTYTAYAASNTFNTSFTLDKTQSEIYWVDTDSNGDWVYRKLNFDATTGKITNDAGVTNNVEATIQFDFDWDDDQSFAGVGVNTLTWNGSGVTFKQSGETGSSSQTVTLPVGDYMMNVVDNQGGFDVVNSGSRINFYDGDGSDVNSKVVINVTSGNASFDSKGNLSVTGTPPAGVSNNADFLESKIGSPTIYQGGTDDNSIFFNYQPENITTSSTDKNSDIQHVFDDPANVTNSLTSSNSNVTITPQSVADLGGKDNSLSRKHYLVTITGVNLASQNDVNITVTGNKTASGIQKDISVARIKLVNSTTFLLWFVSGDGTNTFVRDWNVKFGYTNPSSTSNTGSTTKLLSIGDTINGHQITNIVNYVVDVALKRTVSSKSKQGINETRVTESKFISTTGGTNADFNRTKGWLHLNATNDLVSGMEVFGDGVSDGTYITGVDNANRFIYINKPVNDSKIKIIKFADAAVNRVSVHTLCYATLDGNGSNFSPDTEYTSNDISIIVRAGKGIINRSAIVGVYNSKDRKEIKYTPIFYSSNNKCIPEVDSDEYGEFVLGTIAWNDNTKDTNEYLMFSPKNEIAYKISAIYLSFTLAPISRDKFYYFLELYNEDKNIITLYERINSYVLSNIGSKKAASTYDDVCRDSINLDYFKSYDPVQELNILDLSSSSIIDAINDECILKFQNAKNAELPQGYDTIDSVKDRFAEVVEKSLSNSSFLSDEYYNKLINDKDSVVNRVKEATKKTNNVVPVATRVDNLPPSVEGSDNSGIENIAYSYRDLPPAMDRVKYYVEDLIISDDRYMSPNLDLDPGTTVNQPKLVFRSKPCWTNSESSTIALDVTVPGVAAATINININKDSDNYVTNITTSLGSLTSLKVNNLIIGTNATAGTPTDTSDPGYIAPGSAGYVASSPGTPGSGCNYTVQWKAPSPKDASDNIYVGERSESMGSGAYYESTNSSLPPNLRDLHYKDRSSENDISDPTTSAYPKVLWEPNVSYQMDYYKLFWFRLNELTELIGETLQNLGNPYMDSPINTTITEDVTSVSTSIKVVSTVGFLSSGYLIIPKYTKKIQTDEGGNNSPFFTYSGEEIIYYGSKTDNSFDNIVRGSIGSTPVFLKTITAPEMKKGTKYKIVILGNTDWSLYGAGVTPSIGDVFIANGKGKGTGVVEVFGTNSESNPDDTILEGSQLTPKISIITSYEKGFSVSQHWVYSLKEN